MTGVEVLAAGEGHPARDDAAAVHGLCRHPHRHRCDQPGTRLPLSRQALRPRRPGGRRPAGRRAPQPDRRKEPAAGRAPGDQRQAARGQPPQRGVHRGRQPRAQHAGHGRAGHDRALEDVAEPRAPRPQERQWVDRIGAAAARLARTVDRMLKLVRNREFSQSLDTPSRSSWGRSSSASIDELSPYLELRQQTVTSISIPKLGPLEADPSKISDVLINLLANAVKFTPDGGTIRLEARAEPEIPTGSASKSATRGWGSRPATSSTSSSRSSPASTRSAIPPATTSSASAESGWVSGWSRPSSSCTEAASRSRARQASARPSPSSCRDRRATGCESEARTERDFAIPGVRGSRRAA